MVNIVITSYCRFSLLLLLVLPSLLYSQGISWHPTNGPYGGDIGVLMTGPTGTIFAGTEYGLYRSDDGGKRWRINGLQNQKVNALARDSAGVLYAGTNRGLWMSSDNGGTWLPKGFSDTSVLSIAVQSNGWLFVGVYPPFNGASGLYRSVDGGADWAMLDGLQEYYVGEVIQISVLNDSIVFATGVRTLLRSSDNGETWCPQYHALVLSGHSTEDSYEKCCGIYSFLPYANGDSVLVSDQYSVGHSGECEAEQSVNSGPLQDVYTFFRDTDGAILAGAKGQGMFRSTDNGWNWEAYGPATLQVHAILGLSSGELIVGTSVDGLFRSEGGRTSWKISSEGITLLDITQIVGLKDNVALLVTPTGLFRTSNGGESWSRDPFYSTQVNALARGKNGVLYAGATGSGTIARSTDQGETWSPITVARSAGVLSILPTTDRIFVGARGELIEKNGAPTPDYYELSPNLHRSTDDGQSWEVVLRNVYVRAMVQTPDGSLLALAKGLLRSTDGGTKWSPLPTAPDTAAEGLFSLPDGSVYALFNGKLWRSDDNGNVWSLFGEGLPDTPSNLLLNREGTLFAVVSSGRELYKSSDRGITWEQVDDSLPGPQLAIDDDGYLYAGGAMRPVYRSVGPTVSVDESANASLSRLGQNAPDPFSEQTTVRYSLQRHSHVRLSLTDALGREVRVLCEEEKEGGEHELEVRGEGLSPGLYFIRLVVDEMATNEAIIFRR